jgi:rubrerythrin
MRSFHEVLTEAAARPGVSAASRRSVFALAAVAPLALGLEGALGKGGDKKKQQQQRQKREKKQAKQRDIAILNYALTLEHLEYAFYRDALGGNGFGSSDFSGYLDPNLYARLLEIRDHEGTHVDALTKTIQGLGGDPVQEQCYNFGYTSPQSFLGVAQALENTGVSAYDGAIAGIKSAALQTTGATIATVEARHAAYLNLINGTNPFPAAFDEPKTKDEILAIAGQFIVPCPS